MHCNGFRPLVRYIGAKERDGENLHDCACDANLDDTKREWIVSFSMPSKYNEDSLPNPNNNMVFTEVVPPTVTAVIGSVVERMQIYSDERPKS